jgi:hypothetical protein
LLLFPLEKNLMMFFFFKKNRNRLSMRESAPGDSRRASHAVILCFSLSATILVFCRSIHLNPDERILGLKADSETVSMPFTSVPAIEIDTGRSIIETKKRSAITIQSQFMIPANNQVNLSHY